MRPPRPSFALSCASRAAFLLALAVAPAAAQIPAAEYASRHDSLAARMAEGVLIAFSGSTPVTDFGPFYQLPAFQYLTDFEELDAALVMVVRGGKPASATLFLSPVDPRMAFYYGRRPDSATVVRTLGMGARPFESLRERISTAPREIAEIEAIMRTRPPRAVS
jgi:hypothetical protein